MIAISVQKPVTETGAQTATNAIADPFEMPEVTLWPQGQSYVCKSLGVTLMTASETTDGTLHRAYVEAINSNDIDRIMALMSDDIVFQAPGEPELIGKAAVYEWAASFFEAFKAHWNKTEIAFERSGDLAISRYAYIGAHKAHEGEEHIVEHGKGTCVFKRGGDGRWLLIIDSWSTNEAGAEG
jgi:ketosteroid isomerase-like protein